MSLLWYCSFPPHPQNCYFTSSLQFKCLYTNVQIKTKSFYTFPQICTYSTSVQMVSLTTVSSYTFYMNIIVTLFLILTLIRPTRRRRTVSYLNQILYITTHVYIQHIPHNLVTFFFFFFYIFNTADSFKSLR